jgi:plasmid maintenance system antidote protein VapI
MKHKKKVELKFPENLLVKEEIIQKGIKQTHIAKKLGVSNIIINRTLNGHHKGINLIPAIKGVINK